MRLRHVNASTKQQFTTTAGISASKLHGQSYSLHILHMELYLLFWLIRNRFCYGCHDHLQFCRWHLKHKKISIGSWHVASWARPASANGFAHLRMAFNRYTTTNLNVITVTWQADMPQSLTWCASYATHYLQKLTLCCLYAVAVAHTATLLRVPDHSEFMTSLLHERWIILPASSFCCVLTHACHAGTQPRCC